MASCVLQICRWGRNIFLQLNGLVKVIFRIFASGFLMKGLQDIAGKQKAFAIISRSAKSLGNLLEIT